jgi:hypothetical protein
MLANDGTGTTHSRQLRASDAELHSVTAAEHAVFAAAER